MKKKLLFPTYAALIGAFMLFVASAPAHAAEFIPDPKINEVSVTPLASDVGAKETYTVIFQTTETLPADTVISIYGVQPGTETLLDFSVTTPTSETISDSTGFIYEVGYSGAVMGLRLSGELPAGAQSVVLPEVRTPSIDATIVLFVTTEELGEGARASYADDSIIIGTGGSEDEGGGHPDANISSVSVSVDDNTAGASATYTVDVTLAKAFNAQPLNIICTNDEVEDSEITDSGVSFENATFKSTTLTGAVTTYDYEDHARAFITGVTGSVGTHTFTLSGVLNPSSAGTYILELTSAPDIGDDVEYTSSAPFEITDGAAAYSPAKKVRNLKVKKKFRKQKSARITWQAHKFKTKIVLQKWNKKKKKYKKHKTYRVKKNKKKKVMKRLKPGTKYRVRARKQRTVSGTKYYSNWTKWVKFKTNK